MAELFPSLLAADQQKLDHYIKELEPLCPGFHIDIMDNKFVPNTGIPIEKVNHIAKITYRQLWVHLMVQEPESYVNQLLLPPDSIFVFHIESNKNPINLIKNILDKKWLPGIAISPKTGVGEVFPLLESVYQILIMSVEPGFSGQPFLPETLNKIDPLVGFRTTSESHFRIAIDGGIGISNIKEIAEKGVNQIAIGSGIFGHALGAAQAYSLLIEKAE